jgi:predicted nucleic acid-binding protein
MKYVLDSSVALKFVLPEVDSGKAIRLRDDYRKGIHDLISPDIFTSEVANGLVSAERSARIKKGESAILLVDIMHNAPVFHPSNPLLVRAMHIADRHTPSRLRLHLSRPRRVRPLRTPDS